MGYNEQADRSVHFSYEMVALSPRCCAELGIPLSEEDKKRPYVEVSGRKGLGVKADDLMDKLIEKALEEVASRHAEAPAEEQRAVATQIAIGALRYFLLKFTRNSVIAFDLQEALSFEGETGPYVQYAAVRARNILRKLEERGETHARFRDGTRRGGDGAAARIGRLLADAAGGVEGRFGGRSARLPPASPRTWRDTRFSSRRRSAISTSSIPSFTRRIARRRCSCCG